LFPGQLHPGVLSGILGGETRPKSWISYDRVQFAPAGLAG